MSRLYVICGRLYLLLHLLYLIHRQWRHCFHLRAPVTRRFPLMTSHLSLPIRHPLIIFLFFNFLQLASEISRDILSPLTALLLIVLVLRHWHGHDCVVLGGWRRLRDRPVEGQLVDETWLVTLSLFSQVFRRVVLTGDFVGDLRRDWGLVVHAGCCYLLGLLR